MGDLDVETGELASVDGDVARWTGARVALEPGCFTSLERVKHCNGREIVCSACTEIGFEAMSRTHGAGFGTTGARSSRADGGNDCAPCPPDANAQELEQLRALVAKREFFVTDAVPNGPALFRTRAACVKARKQRRDAK